MLSFRVEVIDGEVFIDGDFVSQLCWDAESIGCAVTDWLNNKLEQEESI